MVGVECASGITMKISSQEEYGLRCLMQVAQAKAPLTIRGVARKEGLSGAYVGKLLFKLRRSGLVKSLRGAKGGYILGGAPGQMTLARVMRALSEGPLSGKQICSHYTGLKKECVHMSGCCSLRSVWNVIYESAWGALERTTLKDLIEREEGELSTSLRAGVASGWAPVVLDVNENRGGQPHASA